MLQILSKKTVWTLAVLAFVCGAVSALYAETFFQAVDTSQSIDFQEVGTQYQFINPLLFCTDQPLSRATNALANILEDRLEKYIESEKANGDLVDAAVYYRGLNGGTWALVNDDLRSAPASLLKVPLAIGVYQHAEKDPNFLTKKIIFGEGSADVDQSEHFQPPEKIEPKETYNVEELVRYMLIDSDNAALYLLSSFLDQDELQNAYKNLGIEVPNTSKTSYTMSVRTYASFFRILYNASYLDRNSSEHLLSLLSHSAFTQGIVSGIPSGITVAHKFGEANFENGKVQLHDCGIIYRPKSPYLLCVMTHGKNFDTLADTIKQISNTVWNTLEKAE